MVTGRHLEAPYGSGSLIPDVGVLHQSESKRKEKQVEKIMGISFIVPNGVSLTI